MEEKRRSSRACLLKNSAMASLEPIMLWKSEVMNFITVWISLWKRTIPGQEKHGNKGERKTSRT
ncbi:hypothetical protein BDD43_1106 [Mucilaginibacter gracilis]|uniref:Uncharacterized protein n=2 Tax=Mucilaginibacter TaxID=423349 RepID=H1YGZ4_9SPHI|nr:hypothetical protein Mucpa_3299 [Mucilaginibacter paludis DSM 18603]RKR80967.1 hypothetical protein BDD43_1106 [Mucilaginibacter gracilis]